MNEMHMPKNRPCLATLVACWGLVLGLALLPASAAAAPTTYSGEAPVASQSEGERGEALKTALADVVMRVSGDSGALARSDVARAVGEAGRYVLQYQYRRDVASDAGGAAQVRLTLVAEFDAVAVDRMLARLGLVGEGSVATADTGSEPIRLRLWISGIHSARDYARAIGYLTRHSLVRDARSSEARADGVLVEVTSIAGQARLLDTLGGEGTLSVTRADPPVEGIDATLALLP
jgi:hypothetical protein